MEAISEDVTALIRIRNIIVAIVQQLLAALGDLGWRCALDFVLSAALGCLAQITTIHAIDAAPLAVAIIIHTKSAAARRKDEIGQLVVVVGLASEVTVVLGTCIQAGRDAAADFGGSLGFATEFSSWRFGIAIDGRSGSRRRQFRLGHGQYKHSGEHPSGMVESMQGCVRL